MSDLHEERETCQDCHGHGTAGWGEACLGCLGWGELCKCGDRIIDGECWGFSLETSSAAVTKKKEKS